MVFISLRIAISVAGCATTTINAKLLLALNLVNSNKLYGDIKPIEYPFILIFKDSETYHDNMCLFDNELTMISIANLSIKGYQFAHIKTFTSKKEAEDYFIENFSTDRNGIKKSTINVIVSENILEVGAVKNHDNIKQLHSLIDEGRRTHNKFL